MTSPRSRSFIRLHDLIRGDFGTAVVGIRCAAYDRPIDGRGTPSQNPSGNSPPEEERTEMIEAQPTVVSLTDAAATKLRELTAEETNPQIGLRVYVYSGGCSGFRYGMMLEDAPTAEDQILKANGVTVYVDGSSVDLLKGSSIDYVDTLMGAGFTVNNPNAVAACGCGSSFRTADDSGTARSCAH
jgi:iron-sulfur cluster assembly protein